MISRGDMVSTVLDRAASKDHTQGPGSAPHSQAVGAVSSVPLKRRGENLHAPLLNAQTEPFPSFASIGIGSRRFANIEISLRPLPVE